MRKELARVNVRYQRAAARCAKMEAREVRGDAVARWGIAGRGGSGTTPRTLPRDRCEGILRITKF